MKVYKLAICAHIAALANIGCSAGDDASSSDPSASQTQQTILNEVHVGGGQVRFVELRGVEGRSQILIHEIRPAQGPSPVIHRLMEQHPNLTNLELLQALAPEVAPHDALVRAHSKEVLALNRSDAAIQSVEFDTDALMEKSWATCRDWIFANLSSWSGDDDRNQMSYGAANWETTNKIRSGVCAEGNYSVSAVLKWEWYQSATVYDYGQINTTVASGWYSGWYDNSIGPEKHHHLSATAPPNSATLEGYFHVAAGGGT